MTQAAQRVGQGGTQQELLHPTPLIRNPEDAKASGIGFAQAPRGLIPNLDEFDSSRFGISTCQLAPESGVLRDSPRPPDLRNATYADRFDWDTLFYDVYRVGRHIVFQAPPFYNLEQPLRDAALFRNRFGPIMARSRFIARNRGNEIWLRDAADEIELNCALGRFEIAVQPNLSDIFAGRRVIITQSKNNDLRWIVDWARYYQRIHGADAVLLYDNGSTAYHAADIEAALTQALPNMVVRIVDWPFRYGPQGGEAGAVGGQPTAWDSDYCQTGSLQHARFRFLLKARSVLNVDIDELVASASGESIFAATERSRHGFIKFEGHWISTTAHPSVTRENCRHGDFTLREADTELCPPKWCIAPRQRTSFPRQRKIVPQPRHFTQQSWSVHNLFGARYNRQLSAQFRFRHLKGISNSWKEARWESPTASAIPLVEDTALREALAQAGLYLPPLPL